MEIKAILFDLDGVITDTAELHYKAWKQIAKEVNIEIDREFNETLKGIDRVKSFDRILKHGNLELSEQEKEYYLKKKNDIFRDLIDTLTQKDILDGISEFFDELIENNIKISIASASKNAPYILEKLNLIKKIDGIANPESVENSKPAPDIFLKAAEIVGVDIHECVGIEDAKAGIKAINAANMFSVGIGKLEEADLVLNSTSELNLEILKKEFFSKL